MGLQQIVIEQSTQTVGLAFQAVDEHLLFGSGTGCPLHQFNFREEKIDILDAILAGVPDRYGVVVRPPCAIGCHFPVRIVGSHVGHSIVGGNVGLSGCQIWKTGVAIHQQSVRITGFFNHGRLGSFVFIGRFEHVVASAEGDDTEEEQYNVSCLHCLEF